MRSLGRSIRLTLLIVFALPVAAKALLWSLDERPRNWWEARWSSAGILPAATSDPEPRVYVFAARTGGWRSIFAVHTWIVLKPANAASYTRYDVTGFRRPLRINGYPPDSYWIGNRPDMIAAIGGDRAAAAIPKPAIGYLTTGSPALLPDRVRAFHRGLSETGFVEGQNLAIEYRGIDG